MDPPIPANVLETLQAAEADLRLLVFKYAVLAAAISKRPAAPVIEGEADGSIGGGGLHGGGGGLSEEDLLGFLDQHVRSHICLAFVSSGSVSPFGLQVEPLSPRAPVRVFIHNASSAHARKGHDIYDKLRQLNSGPNLGCYIVTTHDSSLPKQR